jgi:hypothetical protein
VEALQRFQWTKSLKHLSWAESNIYTNTLLGHLSHSAYLSPLVFDMNPYIELVPEQLFPDPIRRFLYRILPRQFTATDRTREKFYETLTSKGVSQENVPKAPFGQTPFLDFIARLFLAFFGGGLLLAPIIAMSFVNSQSLRLIIASIFVVIVSVALSLATTASNQEIIAGVAAYTAVVVVFVGSALSSATV